MLCADDPSERIDEDVVVAPVVVSPFEFLEVAEYLFGKRTEREFDRVLEQLNFPYLGNVHTDLPLEIASSR